MWTGLCSTNINLLSIMPYWNCLQILFCPPSQNFFWKISFSHTISEAALLSKVSKFFLFWSIGLGYNEIWYCVLLAFFTICPFYHCFQIYFFPSSLPTSAWGRYAELLSKHRKTARKLYHERVVSPRRCFSIGKSMKRWKKSIGNELRRRL